MDRYCSNCNNVVVPSTVGYLCPGCGTVHKFEHTTAAPAAIRLDEFLQADIDSKRSKKPAKPSHAKHHKKSSHKKSAKMSDLTAKKAVTDSAFVDLTAPPKPVQTTSVKPVSGTIDNSRSNKTIKGTMKRLLVPELPAPHFSNAAAAGAGAATMPTPDMPVVAPAQFDVDQGTPNQSSKPASNVMAAAGLAATGEAVDHTAPTSDEIAHGNMIRAELEDAPTTNAIHVFAIVLASVLLIAAGVLIYILAR